jgi:hypothetical protein
MLWAKSSPLSELTTVADNNERYFFFIAYTNLGQL